MGSTRTDSHSDRRVTHFVVGSQEVPSFALIYIYFYTLVSTMTASQFQQCKETTSESFKPAYTFAKIIRKVTNSNRFLKETQLKRASLPAQSSLSPSLIKPIPRRSCQQKPPQEFWW